MLITDIVVVSGLNKIYNKSQKHVFNKGKYMMCTRFKFFIMYLILLLATSSLQAYRVGLLVTATGKYKVFVLQLVKTAQQFFLPEHEVTCFIFTDAVDLEPMHNMVVVPAEQKPWPFSTMMRSEIYYDNRALFEEYDYLYAIDADMRFAALVGDEILSQLVATQHPGFVGRRGTFETNFRSTACVHPNEQTTAYKAGGFYGGQKEQFLDFSLRMIGNIKADLESGIIAVWHDESHLNRCFIDTPPTLLLSPEYCYPDPELIKVQGGHYAKCNGKLLTVNKDLTYMRS